MSTSHDPSELHEASSRRPSRNSDLDTRSAQDSLLSIEQLISKCEKLRESPQDVQQWLESLEPKASGSSKVPQQVLLLTGTASYNGNPCTFIEVLADWVFLWRTSFAKSRKKADKLYERANPVRLSKESNLLIWLLEFVNDYLDLSDGSLPASQIQAMTATVIELCSGTHYHCDVEAAIPILSTVAKLYEFPSNLILETMVVLASSFIHVPEAADEIFACLQALISKGLGVNELFDFTLEPTEENNGHGMMCARGALRLLRRAIGMTNQEGAYIVDLDRLGGNLSLASRHGLFRYIPDIINTCHTILSSNREPELMPEQVEQILETAATCIAAFPEVSGKSSIAPSAVSTTRSDTDRALEKHHVELQTNASALGTDIYSLSDARPGWLTLAVIDYVLANPLYSPVEHVIQCLDHAMEKNLFVPPAPRWNDRCDWLQQKFLSEEGLPPECRIYAINLDRALLEVFNPKWSSDLVFYVQSHSPVSWLCSGIEKAAMQITPLEESQGVLEALYGLLADLTAGLPDQEQGQELATRIIERLVSLTKLAHQSTTSGTANALCATTALAKVLAKNFHHYPRRTCAAYEALIFVASMECKIVKCRIEAMRALYRIRSTNEGYVYLSPVDDSDYIARALCRTRDSAVEFDYDIPATQRHSASGTSLSSKVSSYENLWMYDDERNTTLNSKGPSPHIKVLDARIDQHSSRLTLRISSWLVQMIACLQSDKEWETYSFCLVNSGSQLSNVSLFENCPTEIATLRRIVCEQLVTPTVREPPAATGLKKSDVALCLYNVLTPLIAYASRTGDDVPAELRIQKEFGDDLVKAFLHGLGGRNFEGTDRGCIHALSVCALEIPKSVAAQYPNILERLSTTITKSYLTLHILEFLAQVANLAELHSNFLEEEIRQIFAMCILFLEKTRDQGLPAPAHLPVRVSTPSRFSGVTIKRPPYRADMMKDSGEPKYASALAYHTIICWFLSLKLERRKNFVSWLMPRLTFQNNIGKELVDEQTEVLIDMMQRTAFSDLGETEPNPKFAQATDGQVNSASWLMGYSIVTVETAGLTGMSQITKRQASGTTHSIYVPCTSPLPPHHASSHTAIYRGSGPNNTVEILPSHVFLQLVATAAPTAVKDQPIALAEEKYIERALRSFDRISTVDSYKAGVLYIGPGQTKESDFLTLQSGSPDYDRFLQDLGVEVSLEPPLRIRPHGLSYPRDGKSTLAWRDRVTEIVFLVPTMMPANEDEDPEWLTKKAHVGNCHVNIIFNRSGKEWSFDMLRSQFNSVNIIITPADSNERPLSSEEEKMPGFYKVDVTTKDQFPNISPAADPKVVSAEQLPKFVRVLAINANVFSEVWRTKDDDTEFPSAWRARLQAIRKLKTQVEEHMKVAAKKREDEERAKKSQGRGGRSEPTADDRKSTAVTVAEEPLSQQYDFGRWTQASSN